MASIYSATSEGEEGLAAATAETVIALIGQTTVKAKLIEFGVSFDGVSTTAEPVQIRLIRATADGTGTAATVKPWDPDMTSNQCTAKHSYSAEPTKESTPLASWEVHPQSGIVVQYPLGREPTLDNATGSIMCIECTAPATVNVLAYLVWEE